MTIGKVRESNNKRRQIPSILTGSSVIILVFSLSLFYSEQLSHSVKSGLALCANVIIPSVFPFMILSDILYSCNGITSMKIAGDLFEKLFKINRNGLFAFILGITCGFPLGVKAAADLYRSHALEKDEAERLIGFCNNTGPAFIVCGIGMGLRKSVYEGCVLYIAMLLSAVICGVIFSINKKIGHTELTKSVDHRFELTNSIKSAGINTINICSYIVFFACIVGLLRNTLGENYLYLSIIPLIEIGSSTSILSKTLLLDEITSLIFSAFAIGFSGFSVHMQSLSFLEGTDLSAFKYVIMKTLQGIICAIIAIPLHYLLIILHLH